MITVSSGPDWATIMTAFGTVGAVFAALGIALWSERRTDRRLAAEREHSDEQLADERAFSRAQIEEERQVARNREQLTEAYAIQVVLAGKSTGELGKRDTAPHQLAALVFNHGRYTITGIDARLRLGGSSNPSLAAFAGQERVAGDVALDTGVLPGGMSTLFGRMEAGRLTPWDRGVCFRSDQVPAESVPDAYPVVRWTDRWGTCWEHRRGEVQQIGEEEEWVP